MNTEALHPVPSGRLLGPGHGPGVWPLRERLALSTALLDVDNRQASWNMISRRLMSFARPDRLVSWCSARACAKQYTLLLESDESNRHDQLATAEDVSSSANAVQLSQTERIVRRLAAERVDELRSNILLGQKFYGNLKKFISDIESGKYADHYSIINDCLDIPPCKLAGLDTSTTPLESIVQLCSNKHNDNHVDTLLNENDGEKRNQQLFDEELEMFVQHWIEMNQYYSVPDSTWVCAPGLIGSRNLNSTVGVGVHSAPDSAYFGRRSSAATKMKSRLTLRHGRPRNNSKAFGDAGHHTKAAIRAADAAKHRYLSAHQRTRHNGRGRPRKVPINTQQPQVSSNQINCKKQPNVVRQPSPQPSYSTSAPSTPSTVAMSLSDLEDDMQHEHRKDSDSVADHFSTAPSNQTTDSDSDLKSDDNGNNNNNSKNNDDDDDNHNDNHKCSSSPIPNDDNDDSMDFQLSSTGSEFPTKSSPIGQEKCTSKSDYWEAATDQSDKSRDDDALSPNKKSKVTSEVSMNCLQSNADVSKRGLRMVFSRHGADMTIVSMSEPNSTAAAADTPSLNAMNLSFGTISNTSTSTSDEWHLWANQLLTVELDRLLDKIYEHDESFARFRSKKSSSLSKLKQFLHGHLDPIVDELEKGLIRSKVQFVHSVLAVLAELAMTRSSNTERFVLVDQLYRSWTKELTDEALSVSPFVDTSSF